MKIYKTTDYFGVSLEEAKREIEDYTIEERKVLDAGLEHYFFKTYEGLEREINSERCKEYISRNEYEVLLFEFVSDNINHNKYCMVFK